MARLTDLCETWPLVILLQVGCSLGRRAADAFSDVDATLGIDAPSSPTAPNSTWRWWPSTSRARFPANPDAVRERSGTKGRRRAGAGLT
jgi:hypothetical protein